MTAFMRIVHLGQALLSSYGALHSYLAVTNLQKYESTSEKLAEWSKDAANELHKTRTTQTTAALAVRLHPIPSHLQPTIPNQPNQPTN
jgi:cytochrome c-type biogenesis protein CcmH/NrfG